MTKKLFSFIHREDVHIAPETKVIKKGAFSTLVEAKDVLQHVKEDANHYKLEVAAECEKLKEKAQQDGFEEGFVQWLEKITELEEEIKRVRKDVERVIFPIALKAAKKIIGRELDTSDTAVVDIIATSLKGVAQHKKIIVYVNRKDLEAVEKNRERLKDVFESLESLSIQPKDDVDQGGCIIETEGGIINAQLENQWMALESAFQKMMKSGK